MDHNELEQRTRDFVDAVLEVSERALQIVRDAKVAGFSQEEIENVFEGSFKIKASRFEEIERELGDVGVTF